MKKKNDNKYEYFAKALFYCAIFLISFIFFNILITSTLYIFKVSTTKVSVIASFICSIGLQLFLLIKNKDINKSLRIISLVVPIVIIVCSIFVSAKFYDISFDGNMYHKLTIGKLASGWNPLYQRLEEYDKENNDIAYGDQYYLYVDHYAKGSEIYASNFAKITGKIESGKNINIISAIALFMFVVSFILNEKKEWLLSILFGLVVTSCITITSQMLSYYVDALSYVFLFLIIISFLMIDKFNLFKNKDNYLILFIMAMVIGINIKFSLFAFFGLYCLGYYVWYLIRLKKKTIDINFFKRFTVAAIISVVIGVFVVGLSVYPKNFITKGHPFYPLMGDNAIDIMTTNQPDNFKNMKPAEKFFIATFSKTENIIQRSGGKAALKVPFVVYPDEIQFAGSYDLRISGNGPLFGGILIISLGVFFAYICGLYKKDKKLFYLFVIPVGITFLLILFLGESWWARYFPQLHLIVFFALALLFIKDSKTSNRILYMLIALILFNNSIFLHGSLKNNYNSTKSINYEISQFKKEHDKNNCFLSLYPGTYPGTVYNFKEKLNGYKIEVASQEEYSANEEAYDNFFGGRVKWRCK